ncbi:membrane protein [Cellulophaga sp. Hel_I_12]|uniref:membrane protein n=1 Tax=Cellulophaga sp. Hel_I_12 TaxID=1249972 RepID=UPI0006457C58|nr:membrane protein [Cellulophaga sp. Hel_I_12]
MIRKLVVVIVAFASWGLTAQSGSSSPYSYFGLGDIIASGTVDNQMMGGISMHADSIHINLKNPAAYSQLRLTTYAAGISHKRLGYTSATSKENSTLTNLDYLSIGVPLSSRMGMGFGLMPFSSVGYNIESSTTDANETTLSNEYSGDGGLNRVYLSLGYKILENLSVGATVNYNFGTINNRRVQSSSDVQFGTLDRRESKLSGYDFNYSLNYTPKLNDKYRLYSSLAFDTQVNLNAENQQSLGSFSRINGQEIEVFEVDLQAEGLNRADVRIPTIATLGLGMGEDLKWFVGAEYSFQSLTDYKNDFFQVDNLQYGEASTFAVGGYYIPDYSSFTNYFNRVVYRAGLRYADTGMVINNESINDFGITFGTGLPLKDFSNLNIGFEFGQRGTIDAGLIKENYFKFNIGLSLNAEWFYKRKIN